MAEIKRPRVMGYPPPPSADPLPCLRCNSTVTKFCYYNNYNLAQPRHFCRSCRRYWTQGGALRDVPSAVALARTKPNALATNLLLALALLLLGLASSYTGFVKLLELPSL